MNLYEVLNVEYDATPDKIRKAYLRESKKVHPDVGGRAEDFDRVNQAYAVLSDPERRKRYDATGRTDISSITEQRVREVIRETIKHVISAVGADNPQWDNIRDNIIRSFARGRKEVYQRKHTAENKLNRAKSMLSRFVMDVEGIDFVGEAIRAEISVLQEELLQCENALELSEEIERLLNSYEYVVGPQPEGQRSQEPTVRRSEPR